MKPMEIKVRGCDNCPIWNYVLGNELSTCEHPYNMYDGNKSEEFIEHCPLKETETIIKFERDEYKDQEEKDIDSFLNFSNKFFDKDGKE